MVFGRQKMVLKAIVEEFVKTAEPVGSKTLTNRPEFALNVSSATIRNDMAELEEMGLIVKTHSSSGRIPSEEGYRAYVQSIIEDKDEEVIESFPLIDEIFERDLISREQAIKESMSLITNITNYASVVLGTSGYNSKIKKLQFIPLNDKYAVILMVTDRGYVESKKIIIPPDIKVKEIEKVVDFLDETLHDCSIADIDHILKEKMNEDNIKAYIEYYDDLLSTFVRVFTQMAQDKYFLSGKTNILNQPEFQDVDKAKMIIEALEKEEIVKAISMDKTGLTVKIGHENTIKAMQDCTMITVPYELDGGERGAIAIFGPTRMDYQKVIPLLEYIAQNIKKIK